LTQIASLSYSYSDYRQLDGKSDWGIMNRGDLSSHERVRPTEEAHYRSLFEGVPIGLYITTPDGRILDANPALVKMLRYPNREALLGTPAPILYADPSDREHQCSLFEDERAYHDYETRLKRWDGQLIWVRDICHVIRDESGAIRCFEGSLQNITEQKASEIELNRMARHDPLTGVFNRYALSEVLEQEASRAQRYRRPIGVLMVDVNRFKEVNDRFGHATGDKVLQLVADVLRSTVRDTDYVVRYGGDEFLLLLLEANGETELVRDRIMERMAARNPVNLLVDFSITLSIGISFWKPDSNLSMESVLSQADAAMYEDKRRQILACPEGELAAGRPQQITFSSSS
jgi:diguanylate cyclase (GGDEF)-like protein/PAS domain S-box-containing protein